MTACTVKQRAIECAVCLLSHAPCLLTLPSDRLSLRLSSPLLSFCLLFLSDLFFADLLLLSSLSITILNDELVQLIPLRCGGRPCA